MLCEKCGHTITDRHMAKDAKFCSLRCRCRAIVGEYSFLNPIQPTPLLSKKQIGDIKKWIAQPQIDGWRVVVFHNSWGKQPNIYSNSGIDLTRWKGLQAVRQEFKGLPIGVYDCELWVNGGKSSDILRLKEGLISGARLTIVDLIVDNIPLMERYLYLQSMFNRKTTGRKKPHSENRTPTEFKYINLVDVHLLDERKVEDLSIMVGYAKRELGYKGLILKRTDSLYELTNNPALRERTSEDWIKIDEVKEII